MDDRPTPQARRVRKLHGIAASPSLTGWSGAWMALVVLAGWQVGASLHALASSGALGAGDGVVDRWFRNAVALCAAGAGSTSRAPAAVLAVALSLSLWALLRLCSLRRRKDPRAIGAGARAVFVAWAALAVASGWRSAAAAPTRCPDGASGDPWSGRSHWIVRVERIDWTRSPPRWSGHAFAWLEDGRWFVSRGGVPASGNWDRPEAGAMLLQGAASASNSGKEVRIRIGRAHRLTGGAGDGTRSFAARSSVVRLRLSARVLETMGPDAGALAVRTLLGPSLPLPPGWDRPFRETGTLHLLSISGFHLTLLGGILWLCLRILTRGASWSRWPALGALALYAAFVGGGAPVARSCGAALLLAVGPAWGRAPRLWNALGWMAALLPACDPGSAATASFRLSFAAMAGVLWGGALADRCATRARSCGPLRPVVALLGASAGATLLTAPWSLHHFGLLYPWGVAANLLAIPAASVTLAVQGIAVLALAVGAGASFPLVAAGRDCGEGFLAGLRLLAGICGRWAWIGGLDLAATLAWTILLGLVLLLCGRARRPAELARALPWVVLAALPAALAALAHAARERPMARAAGEVCFLDVGQGDAALLRLDDRHWLYDLGVGGLGGRRDRLVPALLARGVRRIERVWITHGDSDHWGGLADLLAAPIRIDTLVIPEGAPFPAAFWETLASEPKRPVVERVASGWSRRFGSRIQARVLHPPPARTLGGDLPRGANAWSVVLLLEGPPAADGTSVRLLLSGDLERAREPAMLRSWREGRAASVATLAHHGSRGAGSEAWWRRARPLLAVISVGAGNPYRLPHPATLAAAARYDARLRRTDENGAIRCAFGPGWIRVRSERPPCPSGTPVL